MSPLSSILAHTPITIFLFTFVSGVVLLVRVLDLTTLRSGCVIPQNVTLPPTPRELETGFVFSATDIIDSKINHNFVEFWLPAMFAFGVVAFLALYVFLYFRASKLHIEKQEKQRAHMGKFRMNFVLDPSYEPPISKLSLHDFVTKSRRVLMVNTCLTTVSTATWLGLVFGRSSDLKIFLRLLDPSLTSRQFVEVLTFYLCHNNYHATLIFALESFLVGCGVVSICMLLLPGSRTRRTDVWLGLLDITNCCFTIWALPFAYYVPQIRCYSLYLLSGFIRTIRAFYGVPEIAREYNLLASNTRDKRAANKSLRLGLWERLRLLFGELALVFKVGTFVFSSTLMMIAVEGWACEYQVPSGVLPSSCPKELGELVGGIYFVTTVCATVGFGDFAPITKVGRFVIIFVMLSGAYQLPDWLDHLKGQRTNRMLTKKLSQIRHNASRNDSTISRVKRSHSSRDRLLRLMRGGESQGSTTKRENGSSSSLGTFNPYPTNPIGDRNSQRSLPDAATIMAGLKAGVPHAAGRLGMGARVVGNLADVSGLVARDTEPKAQSERRKEESEEYDECPEPSSLLQRFPSTPLPNAEPKVVRRPSAVGWKARSNSAVDDEDEEEEGDLHQVKAKMDDEDVADNQETDEQSKAALTHRHPTHDEAWSPLSPSELASCCEALRTIEANSKRLKHTSLALQAVVYGLCSTLDSDAATRVMDRQQARSLS